MSDEPRRSGRATKGQHQHKNASSSPAPAAPAPAAANASNSKPAKGGSKSKSGKKSKEPQSKSAEEVEEDDGDEIIRCICGDTNPKDRRAFIGCDTCAVWQHNVCMGMHDDDDEVPDNYFCEECAPEDHQETLQAMERGEKIWEKRNKIFQNEKKMSKSRKNKNRSGEEYQPGWLKKNVAPEPAEEPAAEEPAAPSPPAPAPAKETGNKRKREVKEEADEPAPTATPEEKPAKPARQDKRRKSSNAPTKDTMDSAAPDTDTTLVNINELPQDRQKVARALAAIIKPDIEERVKSGTFKIPAGRNSASLGEHHAARIEYALHMNHGSGQAGYGAQFRSLNANLKRNKVLLERLLEGSLSADELSTMSSSDMASEELQRERAEMKEVLDRQAMIDQPDGPKYAQDHKGYHLIENESQAATSEPAQKPQPVKNVAPPASASPAQNHQPLAIDTSKPVESTRRSSSQQFDMNNIWAKTGSAQSPTNQTTPVGARQMQAPVRRKSSVHPAQPQQNGAKEDADVDRMLEDNDDSYVPPDAMGDDAVVWRGKLAQSGDDGAPTVNARFVAGRDISSTVSWQELLPQTLSIDGRLQINKAEEYLCNLRFSKTSDVAILSLTPYDNAEAFNNVFTYFHSRQRYAVVEKAKPEMVKDLYIIPVEVGSNLPDHVDMLEHCTIKQPVEERLLLATLVVARAPESPTKEDRSPTAMATNGHLPQHMRQSIGGPAGSPLTAQHPSFSPSNSVPPAGGYGTPSAPNAFPPNPYGPPQPPSQQPVYPPQPPAPQPHPDPDVNAILGELQYVPTAQIILREAGNGLNLDQLHNLKAILTEEPGARTDFAQLAQKLYPQGGN